MDTETFPLQRYFHIFDIFNPSSSKNIDRNVEIVSTKACRIFPKDLFLIFTYYLILTRAHFSRLSYHATLQGNMSQDIDCTGTFPSGSGNNFFYCVVSSSQY